MATPEQGRAGRFITRERMLVKDRKRAAHRGRAMLTAALLACLLLIAPAAHAAFTSVTTATLRANAYAIPAPTGNSFSAGCDSIGGSGKLRVTIVVSGHGDVFRANQYVLRVWDPSGAVQTPVILAPGGTFQTPSSNTAARGRWTYAIDARYVVPGTTNVWTSAAPRLSVTC